MTSFDQREHAFEAEFAHRDELAFKVRQRAIRLLALWAADVLASQAKLVKPTSRTLLRSILQAQHRMLHLGASWRISVRGASANKMSGG
jgi:hypothetical protein